MLLSDLGLARRLEMGEAAGGLECVQAMIRMHPNAGAAVEKVAGGYSIFLGIGSPLTHALGLGMRGPVSMVELEVVESFYQGRGAAVQIDLCPLADPSLLELLGQRDYRLAEFNTTLVCPLQEVPKLPPQVSGIEVKKTSPIDSRLWGRTVAAGFLEDQELTPKTLDEVEAIFNMASGMCYLAWMNGEPVGGAAMSVRQGLAMFYADSTLMGFRNQGIHTALIYERCAQARAVGCDMATSTTLPGSVSQRNYERAGFRPVYTKAILLKEW